MENVKLRVNGRDHELRVDAAMPLLYVLRNELGLTGAKFGCGLEQCGACAVLVDGRSVLSCNAPVGQFAGCDIRTIEGDSPALARVKAAFVAAGAAQCGYCIPGMVVAIAALLERVRAPTEDDLREALTPHLCRCGTHSRILAAARLAAAENARA
ncbi:MAG: 2Fe-2S iron-sulfur cluster-binding protein [Burkholderiales bacterium]